MSRAHYPCSCLSVAFRGFGDLSMRVQAWWLAGSFQCYFLFFSDSILWLNIACFLFFPWGLGHSSLREEEHKSEEAHSLLGEAAWSLFGYWGDTRGWCLALTECRHSCFSLGFSVRVWHCRANLVVSYHCRSGCHCPHTCHSTVDLIFLSHSQTTLFCLLLEVTSLG